MSFLRSIFSRGRVRSLSKQVAKEPTAQNYVGLAQEFARHSEFREVVRVCEEGQALHPGNVELSRMLGRVGALEREGRMRELQRLLALCPRPALWREACDLLIESSSFERAEEQARDWFEKTNDGEARLYMALACSERFFADRRPEDARRVMELCAAAKETMLDDERVLRCSLRLTASIGAFDEARKSLARLLEIHPGDPELESQFRSLLARGEASPSIEEALRQVQRTGQLVDEEKPSAVRGTGSARPVLQALEAPDHVHAAFYVRGGTALVQGPRGATAERYARCMREIVTASGGVSRRLGLGRVIDVQIEGDFGVLTAVPGNPGSSTLWSTKAANKNERALLNELAGNANLEIEE